MYQSIKKYIYIPSLMYNFLKGRFILSRLQKPVITIFGGARISHTDFYAQKTEDLARKLAEHGISVLTGGGSGIMHAASCGMFYAHKQEQSVGIGVTNVGEGKSSCLIEYVELDSFFLRKFLLMRYSSAFIFFPGGYGTLNELSELLMLIQTKKMKKVPIVLIGIEYWQSFMEWLKKEPQAHGAITQEDLDLFVVTDDLSYVCLIVCEKCKGKT